MSDRVVDTIVVFKRELDKYLKEKIFAGIWGKSGEALQHAGTAADLDNPPRSSSFPLYFPVDYEILDAQESFFLKRVDEELTWNSTLKISSQPFLLSQAKSLPMVKASHGPFSVQQVLPDLLPDPSRGGSVAEGYLSPSWRIRAYIVERKIHAGWPKAQVLFHMSGRDWGSLEDQESLPCVSLHAIRETREVRGDCRLKGPLGICVASLVLPGRWFPPSSQPGKRQRRAMPGINQEARAELYFSTRPPVDCGGVLGNESRGADRAGREELEHVGGVVLLGAPAERETRLDANVLLRLPDRSLQSGETVGVTVVIARNFSLNGVVIRAKLKKGVRILSVHPSVPDVWRVELQHSHGSKHRIATVTCTRNRTLADQSVSPGVDSLEIARLQLETEEFDGEAVTRRIVWQVEYGDRSAVLDRDRIISEIMITQRDIRGLVPLAMQQEVLNTAVLTGRLVMVPIKAVTVEGSGSVTDVSQFVECTSEDENIVKVSKGCDYIYTDGKETRGRQRIRVDLSFECLRATLHLTIWAPKLPLQVKLSDSHLSQVKGWRVPIQSEKSPAGAIKGKVKETGEKKGRGCSLQYQRANLRILTQFVADSPPASGKQLAHMLGPDWQVDVTEMVTPLVRVVNPHMARVKEGRVLVGLEPGVTTVQVLSPVSESILGQQRVTIADDKLTITNLAIQLVAGIRLSLRHTRGNNRVVIATATAQEVLHTPKQEAVLSLWLQYSDGTWAPLQLYDPEDFSLTVTSLDERVVSVQCQEAAGLTVAVVAEGEGGGQLLQAQVAVPPACHKSKRRSGLVLASAEARVEVLFQQEAGGDHQAEGKDEWTFRDHEHYDSRFSEREEGAMQLESTTHRIHRERPGRKRAPGDSGYVVLDPRLSDLPLETKAPGTREPLPGYGGEEFSLTFKGVTDLEIGMYALLGVFCLAILVFFVNCVTFVLKYRRKELLPAQPSRPLPWVWSGTEQDTPGRRKDSPARGRERAVNLGRCANRASVQGDCRVPVNGGVSLANAQEFANGVSLSDPQGFANGVSLANGQAGIEGVSLADTQELTNGVSLTNAHGLTDSAYQPNMKAITGGASQPSMQGFSGGASRLGPEGPPPRGNFQKQNAEPRAHPDGGSDMRTEGSRLRAAGWSGGASRAGRQGATAAAADMRVATPGGSARWREEFHNAGAPLTETDRGPGDVSWQGGAPRACPLGFVDGYCTIKGVSRKQEMDFRPGTLQDFRPKRVQLSTFAATTPNREIQPPPVTQSIIVADEEDIRWVCQDMGLQDPDELRSYMERIREAS
ncbi:transmembrane protein 132C-like [Heterodontus francisci]|uniref:transmembrane protein 132C-like n=1 Tax=Heterodontus francisci TaxID=7792 RepID=UPI00355C762A